MLQVRAIRSSQEAEIASLKSAVNEVNMNIDCRRI